MTSHQPSMLNYIFPTAKEASFRATTLVSAESERWSLKFWSLLVGAQRLSCERNVPEIFLLIAWWKILHSFSRGGSLWFSASVIAAAWGQFRKTLLEYLRELYKWAETLFIPTVLEHNCGRTGLRAWCLNTLVREVVSRLADLQLWRMYHCRSDYAVFLPIDDPLLVSDFDSATDGETHLIEHNPSNLTELLNCHHSHTSSKCIRQKIEIDLFWTMLAHIATRQLRSIEPPLSC